MTICTPGDGATVTSPVRVVAGSTNSRVVRMLQIYLDGAKVYQVKAASLDTPVSMPVGTRRLTVQAIDMAARRIKKTIYVNVVSAQPTVAVSINPTSASLQTGATRQFTATVTGNSNTAVTWTATGGSISSTGLYTAPGTAGSYTVRATSVADASKSASAAVTVSQQPPPAITASPASITFSSIPATNTSSQAVVLTNTGGSTLTVSQASLSGSNVFRVTAPAFPFTLNAGQSGAVTIQFAPQASGTFTGSLAVVSNASNALGAIPVSGTATAAPTQSLGVSPTSIPFGGVQVGSSATRTATLSNTGNSSATVFSASATGSGFSVASPTFPITLAPGATQSVTIRFAPQASGAVTGSAAFTSSATNSPTTVALSGSGSTTVQRSVDLSWNSSTSTVAGYNVYRATKKGGPYTKLNSTVQATTNYTDGSVQSGVTYFYVVTAVGTGGAESVHSNEAIAVVPTS